MVCTGNICRSPLAEHLATARLTRLVARMGLPGPPEAALTVSSAGIFACVGEPMNPNALAVLDERGVRHGVFRARQLAPAMVEQADLVLCATRQHRAQVVTLVPRAVRRTFTLREFARLADSAQSRYRPALAATEDADGCGWLRAVGLELAQTAADARGMMPPPVPEHDDLVDPLGGHREAFRACADAIDAALEPMERSLTIVLGATAASRRAATARVCPQGLG
ncbi:arsenate reductase/protein-tyrosine-phosphatase family protein [Parafrankia elaeagni]|uniref:arsenate reductase/protein-tyrosine-phosphatase family protein n=1 Tax=Parafrankia elaeagni TaxID=222534 RepID=UPI00037B6186|nr:hypothetical protein [Parafrankia elaeagni]